MPQKHLLSKSTFMGGVQCLKKLYLNKYHRELKAEITQQQQAIFSAGTNIGELAQQLFPGGVDHSPENYWNFGPSIEATKASIANGDKVIYEAAFQHEQVLVALDILVLKEDGWHAYEVKGSTSAKEVFVMDAALQYWVISNAGVELQSISIVHLNNQYVRQGELDVQQLFTIADVTEEVLELQDGIKEQITLEKETLAGGTVPDVPIGPHCTSPYSCDFMEHCWKHVPEKSVLDLTRGGFKSWSLFEQGIKRLVDIPIDDELSDAQRFQVEGERDGTVHIDVPMIKVFLDELKYPLCFLDFETIMPGVPIYNGTHAYQQLVFQYSLHIQKERGGEVQHLEVLAKTDDIDFREHLAKRLLNDLDESGDIVVYNQGFEAGRLKELARDLPKYEARISTLLERLVDLMLPFQKKYYYHPAMQGSYSIKYVLPALVPELRYQDLEIQEGGTASLTFLQMVQGSFKGDVAATRQALIEYCKLDTWAMVRLLDRLYRTQ